MQSTADFALDLALHWTYDVYASQALTNLPRYQQLMIEFFTLNIWFVVEATDD